MRGRGQEPDTTQELRDLIPSLRLLARGFLSGDGEADDAVQDTLRRALAETGGFRPGAGPGAGMEGWLYPMLRDACLARARPPGVLESGPAVRDRGSGGARLLEAIRRLPMPCREAWMLVCLLGKSHEAAAAICRSDPGAIRDRVGRARAMLLADLGETSPERLMTFQF